MRKSAWHLHGKERGLLVSTRASDAGWLCDYASGCYCKGIVSRDGDGIRHPRSLVVALETRSEDSNFHQAAAVCTHAHTSNFEMLLGYHRRYVRCLEQSRKLRSLVQGLHNG